MRLNRWVQIVINTGLSRRHNSSKNNLSRSHVKQARQRKTGETPRARCSPQCTGDCSRVGFVRMNFPDLDQANLNSIVFMLETIAIILILLWLLGLVSSYTMGGFIHILLVLAIIVVLVRLIQGRRV
jgi:hypothetical protein